MRINIQNTFNPNHNIKYTCQPCALNLRRQVCCDTISFGGRDFLSLPDAEILRRVDESITEENLIGIGKEAAVFKVKDTNFCVRIPHTTMQRETIINPQNQITRNIKTTDKINHVVLNLDDNITLMPKIKGIPLSYEGETANMVSKFPVTSFNKLLKQISYAYNNGMIFDCLCKNVIADFDDKSFTAIDFRKKPFRCKLEPIGRIFACFSGEKTPENIRKIYKEKIGIAGLMEFEPENKPCLKLKEFDFEALTGDETFIQNIKRVIELKRQELKGKNVAKELQNAIDLAKKTLKKAIYKKY